LGRLPATGLLSGGTANGQSYLNAAIAAAQSVANNSAATANEVTDAYNALTAAITAYQDSSLSALQVNSVAIAGFSPATYTCPPNASVPNVSATATTVDAAMFVVTQATTLPEAATVEVTAGDGTTATYTVNFRVNYMFSWDGNGIGTTADTPDAFGWTCSSSVTWSNADNATDTYAYRYRDNFGVSRVITHPANNNVFSYPLQLTCGKIYRFTCVNSNINAAISTTFGINTLADGTGTVLKSQTKTAPQWSSNTTFDFLFTVTETGNYYLTWQTTNGSDRNLAWNFLVSETGNASSVTFDTDGGSAVISQYFLTGESYTITEPEDPSKPEYDFAGWYTSKAYSTLFNFSAPVSDNTTVYARFVPEGGSSPVSISVVDDTLSLPSAKYMDITVSGNSELHISDSIPMVNSSINLVSENSWLFLDGVRPLKVISDWLSHVKINGTDFNADNDRVAIYGGGTVIILNGKETGRHALTAYKGENYAGESMDFEVNKYYRTDELGIFDNSIRSFKLKKGYSCTFANNPDGTGFSRVYIASDGDIEVPVMPEGLGFASFVRVAGIGSEKKDGPEEVRLST
jgi:uncharacterized repeat protein (TIGR02543 family)